MLDIIALSGIPLRCGFEITVRKMRLGVCRFFFSKLFPCYVKCYHRRQKPSP